MKNLYKYSVKDIQQSKTICFWDEFEDALTPGSNFRENNLEKRRSFENGKIKLGREVAEELKGLEDKINVDMVVNDVILGAGSTTEIYNRNGETLSLRDTAELELVTYERGKELTIKDYKNDRFLEVNLETKEITENKKFGVKPVKEASETKENSTNLVVDKKKIEKVKTTTKNTDSETSKGNDKIVKKKETAEEKKVRLAAAQKEKEAQEKERVEKAQRDAERKEAEKALKIAKQAVGAIDLDKLTLENASKFKDQCNEADSLIWQVEKKSDGLSQFAPEIVELKKKLKEKEDQVDIYKNGAKEKTRIETVYKTKTEDQIEERKEKIKKEVDSFKKEKIDSLKTIEELKISPVSWETTNPKSFQEIQKGMIQYRTESMKMEEEMNFLQNRTNDLTAKIVDFEAKKSEMGFANVGKFVAASFFVVPGTLFDLGAKMFGSEKRSVDLVGDFFGVDSGAEELQKEQKKFETSFAEKKIALDAKKGELDAYGKTLATNSEELRTEEPKKVKANIRKSVEEQLKEKGINSKVNPWKGVVEKLLRELNETAAAKVGPAVNQLDAQVNQFVPTLTNRTDTAFVQLTTSANQIKGLEINSATTLDMSVGFLTKNVAKGLNLVGGGLAKIPVIGVVGGVCRAAGGLVEGVGTMITDPGKVLEGLASLAGYKPGEEFFSTDSWSTEQSWNSLGGLASGLLAGEAWSKTVEAFKKGDLWTGFSEGSAWLGEFGGNVVATVFTGGALGAVRGAGIAGRLGTVARGIAKTAQKIPGARLVVKGIRVAKSTTLVANAGKVAGTLGNIVLAPLKWGLKPLKWFGKKGAKLEELTSRMLTPTQWSKAGRIDALRKFNKKAGKKVENLKKGLDDMGDFEKGATNKIIKKLEDTISKNEKIVKGIDPKASLVDDAVKVSKKSKNIPSKVLKKTGGVVGKIGDVALAPLRWTFKPLSWFGKRGVKLNDFISRMLTPTQWSKAGRVKALKKVKDKAKTKAEKVKGKSTSKLTENQLYKKALKDGLEIKSGKFEGTWKETQSGWAQTMTDGKVVNHALGRNPNLGVKLKAQFQKRLEK